MKTKRYRQTPLQAATLIAREWMVEADSPIEYVRDSAYARVFAIELLAIRCGWKKIEKELESWRESRVYKAQAPG